MLSVVNNVPSLTAQRSLDNSSRMLAISLERLSSGLRINRAADDAAGLAISEGLRAQIRGLNQAARNANDGISMLSTAESAVGETTNLLQRMRELAVQSSNDTNSSANRTSLQSEVDELLAEITRIANTVTFNGMQLIDGTYESTNITLQVGATAGQTLGINLADLRASALGQVASKTGAVVTTDDLAGGDLTINGQAVAASASDGVSSSFAAASAIAKASVINDQSGVTGVTATVIASTAVGDTSTIDAGAAIADGGLTINGVNIGAVTVLVNDSDSALRDAINAVSNQTGVVATLNSSNQLTMTAEDGRNITLGGTGGTNLIQSLGFADGEQDDTFTGQILLSSDSGIQLGGANETYIGFTNDEAIAINANTAINNISVLTASTAGDAITAIDNALRQVSTARSSMGAATNRLESTVSNLRTLSENLTASESRIRDADFAAETANLTKAQILQQAGTAILAQANLTPQAALALLG